MNLSGVINQILMMLLIMALGMLLRKTGAFNDTVTQGLSGLVIKVALPALLFSLVQKESGESGKMNFLFITLLVLAWLSFLMLLIFWSTKKLLPGDKRAPFAALAVLPNAGFMGMPIISVLYGDTGSLYLAAVVVGMTTSLYLTLEVIMTGKPSSPKTMLKNTGLVLSVMAVIFYMTGIRLPVPLTAMMSQLGSLTTPLSMLVAGARLLDFRVKARRDAALWGAIAIKLLVMPLMSFLLFRALGFEGLQLGVITIALSMASASASQMYSEREGKDALYAASGVSISTILCLLSIPMIMLITGV